MAAITITAFFTSYGTPATGLTPVIKIVEVDTAAVAVAADPMTEISDGFYKYVFTGFDNSKDYAYTCDSVTLQKNERYAIGVTSVSEEQIQYDSQGRVLASIEVVEGSGT